MSDTRHVDAHGASIYSKDFAAMLMRARRVLRARYKRVVSPRL
jgi:hypothetical protein